MAAKLLLSGYGGKYTSEIFTEDSTTGTDTIDASRCAQLAVQVSTTGTIAGNFDIQQTFNGSDWALLVTDMAVTDGTVTRLDPTDGPFGLLRIDATDITGTGVTAVVTLVGYPVQIAN